MEAGSHEDDMKRLLAFLNKPVTHDEMAVAVVVAYFVMAVAFLCVLIWPIM